MPVEFRSNNQFYKVHESTYHQTYPREAMRRVIEGAPERERVPFVIQVIVTIAFVAFIGGLTALVLMSLK